MLILQRRKQMSKPRIIIWVYKYSELRQHKVGAPEQRGGKKPSQKRYCFSCCFKSKEDAHKRPILSQPCPHLHLLPTSFSSLIAFKCSSVGISYSVADKNAYCQTFPSTCLNSVWFSFVIYFVYIHCTGDGLPLLSPTFLPQIIR